MAHQDWSQNGRNAFDPNAFNLSTANRDDLNGMILFNLDYYEETDFWGRELWLSFVEEFQDWSTDHLKTASNHVIKRPRNYLRNHGVLVSKQEEKIVFAAALSRTIERPQYRKWPANVPVPSTSNNEDKDTNDEHKDHAIADAAKEGTAAPTVLQAIPPTLLHASPVNCSINTSINSIQRGDQLR